LFTPEVKLIDDVGFEQVLRSDTCSV